MGILGPAEEILNERQLKLSSSLSLSFSSYFLHSLPFPPLIFSLAFQDEMQYWGGGMHNLRLRLCKITVVNLLSSRNRE